MNDLITRLFDGLLAPLAAAPAWNLALLSAASGLVMLVVFRHTSNQAALRAAADRSRAMLMSLRLFRDDFAVAVRSQLELLGAIARRLWHSLPPMLVLTVPFLVLLIQLAVRYEHRPLRVGESAVVEAVVSAAGWPAWREAVLEAGAGIAVETPAVRDGEAHRLSWRVRATAAGSGSLVLRAGSRRAAKRLVAAENAERVCRVNPRRAGGAWWRALLQPGEPRLAFDPDVQRIDVHYPRRATPILGVDLPWWATLLIVSMATALLLRPVFRVQL